MRKISTDNKTLNYEIEIDGKIHNIPIYDYYKKPELAFMLMREIESMQSIKELIGIEDVDKTLDFEDVFSEALNASFKIKDDKKASKMLNNVTSKLKSHLIKSISYLVDYDIKIFSSMTHRDLFAVFVDIMNISEGNVLMTSDDKKKV